MRPNWPSWTSPLAKVKLPCSFIARIVYQKLHQMSFYSLIFQIQQSCPRRELPTSIPFIFPQTKPWAFKQHGIHASKPPTKN
jgi:hypothetical protein